MKKPLAILLLLFSFAFAQETEEVIPRVVTKDGNSFEGEIIELNKKECVIKTEYGTIRIPVSDLYFIDYGFRKEFENIFSGISKGLFGSDSLENDSVASSSNNWETNVKINPMDDSKSYIFSIEAESGTNAYLEKPTLILRMKSGITDVYISWGTYLGNDPKVLTRMPGQTATADNWISSDDKTATFLPSKYDEKRFIKRLRGVSQVVFQATPYSASSITAVFKMEGLKEAVSPYLDELKWDEIGPLPPPGEGPRVRFIPYDDPPVPIGGYSSIQRNIVYPKVAQEGGIEGTVSIQAFVSKKGIVTDTVVLRGIPGLNEAAMDAIRKTKFKPAKQGKRAVGVWINIPVNFRL